MNKLIALLATAIVSLMLGCASPSSAQDFMENPKFLRRAEPVLGLNVQELREALGRPEEIGECHVPLKAEGFGDPIPIPGRAWIYRNRTATTSSTMAACVINNHVVGEQRSFRAMEGSRAFKQRQSLIDIDLIKKAFKGELDKSSHEERILPRTVPEYEI